MTGEVLDAIHDRLYGLDCPEHMEFYDRATVERMVLSLWGMADALHREVKRLKAAEL